MHIKLLALLIVGIALSGCCASGTGCSTQMAGAPIAWDGLGEPPSANDGPGEDKRPKRRTARNREIILGPLNEAPPRSDTKARYDEWTRQPNEDAEADARLARQTKICRGC
ncbi:hypothetical protein IVA95_35455 [Bradyrhizobium sp. 157]|jgi:hypothetical protein|uniref:hypothetical protein n=1 Tax=Bradyrhizobium sp. 157 TaxID=2782631 RepID=UPI001FF8C265|nr:hypothetical protein [Bradyrhizobium sp. 157]MCK1642709.1 hypothetical protein [Bradyrhizobium sp. 157]